MTFKISRKLALLAIAALGPACDGNSGIPPAAPFEAWARTYGGNSSDMAVSFGDVVTTADGYVIAGSLANGTSAWVVRLAADGAILWQKSYGASGTVAMGLDAVPAGGYVLSATTSVLGAGGNDVWIVRLDVDGSIAWQKTYGGTGADAARCVRSTSDGGFIVLASSTTFSGGTAELWILKLSSDGSVAWQKTYPGTEGSYTADLREIPGGGYILAHSDSIGASFGQACLMRLNSDGTIAWQKQVGTTDDEGAGSVTPTSDGGFLMAGGVYTGGLTRAWAVKVDGTGAVLWQKRYSSGVLESFRSCRELSDGTFLLSGVRGGNIGSIGSQCWAVRMSATGTILWQKQYGGAGGQYADVLRESPFGGLVLLGSTSTFGAGVYDLWMLGMDGDGTCGSLGIATSAAETVTAAVEAVTAYTVGNTAVTPANTSVLPVATFHISTQQVP